MDSKSLLIKYRPEKWEAVAGQEVVVRSLRSVLQRRASHAFLFTGPPGLGKTTVARLAAKELGCSLSELIEVDGATYTGIDDMREVTQGLKYRPMGADPAKGIIIDECLAKGTFVDTPKGKRRIEELLAGDKVFGAKDIQTVLSVSRKLVPLSRIIRLRLEGKRSIIVSQEHPFLTFNGWIDAENLYAQRLPFCASGLSAYLSFVWDKVYERRARITILSKMLAAEMRNLRRCIFSAALLVSPDVFSKMCKQTCGLEAFGTSPSVVEGQYTERTGTESTQKSGAMGRHRKAEQFAHVASQPNERPSDNRQDETNKRSQWYAPCVERGTWRQWQRSDTGAGVVTLIGWWAIGVCGYLWTWANAKRLATLLQIRYWIPSLTIGDRSGRPRPCWTTTSKGQNKRSTVAVIGVDRPSLQELTDIGQSSWRSPNGEALFEFYDLEISEHPSFSVEGVVVHNCHYLSKNAWNSLLKSMEEPPSWVYWFLCTTEVGKVPAAIKTRCLAYELKPVSLTVLQELLSIVARAEKINLDAKILALCAKEANGSPRQALANLAVCSSAKTREEAAELLLTADEAPEAIEFVRALYRGAKWGELQRLLQGLGEMNAESIRQIVRAYGTKVVMGAKTEEQAGGALEVLDAFSTPFYGSDGITPILLAVARLTLMDR